MKIIYCNIRVSKKNVRYARCFHIAEQTPTKIITFVFINLKFIKADHCGRAV